MAVSTFSSPPHHSSDSMGCPLSAVLCCIRCLEACLACCRTLAASTEHHVGDDESGPVSLDVAEDLAWVGTGNVELDSNICTLGCHLRPLDTYDARSRSTGGR